MPAGIGEDGAAAPSTPRSAASARRAVFACLALAAALGFGATPAAAAPPHLTYQGGPIMPSATTELVVWGSQVDPALESADASLLGDLAAASGATDNAFSILPEYGTAGQTLKYSQSFGGTFTIAPGTCPGDASCTIEDTAIGAELVAQIKAGILPTPAGNGLTTAYVVLFPPKDRITYQGVASGEQFCSYHGGLAATLNSGPVSLLYGGLPDNNNEYAGSSCGESTNPVDNETSNLTHQLAELITDPMVWANEVAWYDNENGEVGDICATGANGGGEATNTINGHPYVVQKEWSNKANACVSTSTYKTPSGDFTTSTSGDMASFNASASTENGDGSIASYGWSFGDGGTGGGATVAHVYGTAGTYSVTLTITDNLGFVKRITHQVTVGVPAGGEGPGGGGPEVGPAQSPTIRRVGAPSTRRHGMAVIVRVGSEVVCPPGTVSCLVVVKATVNVSVGRKHRRKPVTIGRTDYTVVPGATQPISLKLNGKGKKLLGKLKRLTAKVAISVRYGSETVAEPRMIRLM